MGVAAKSNIEKRQVGCVITGTEVSVGGAEERILAEGFNDAHHHAEAVAVARLRAEDRLQEGLVIKAYVTHQPCPECAKTLADAGITEVEVIEAFMKFDSNKLRYDLIVPAFMLEYMSTPSNEVLDPIQLRSSLYAGVSTATDYLIASLKDTYQLEDGLATILTFGARKYKPGNWMLCQDPGRYFAAAERHTRKLIKGEVLDDETNEPHVYHVLTNLMFLYWFDLQKQA